jgi:hypothetical protein
MLLCFSPANDVTNVHSIDPYFCGSLDIQNAGVFSKLTVRFLVKSEFRAVQFVKGVFFHND